MSTTENHLRFAAMVVFANQRLIAVTSAAALVLAVLVSVVVPPVYKLEGTIIVKSKRVPDRPESGQVENGRFTMPPTQEDAMMETRIITSPEHVAHCAMLLRREGTPVLAPRTAGFFARFTRDTVAEDTTAFDRRCAAAISDGLSTVIFPGSTMIDIRLQWGDAQTGHRILERILDEYPRYRMQILIDRSASAFYAEQVRHYRQNLERLDSSDLYLSRTLGVSDAGLEMQEQVRSLQDQENEHQRLLGGIQQLTNDLEYLDAMQMRYRNATHGDSMATLPPPAELVASISPARQQINDLLMSYYTDMRRFAAGSLQAKQVAQRIRSELENLIAAEKMERNGLMAQAAASAVRTDSLRRRTLALRALMTKQQQIGSDAEMTRSKYQTFSGKLDESRLVVGSEISQWANVQVLTRPVVPEHPWFPRPRQVIPFGLLAGIVLGLALAWMREILDHTFKTPAQVSSILGIPVIASITASRRSRIGIF